MATAFLQGKSPKAIKKSGTIWFLLLFVGLLLAVSCQKEKYTDKGIPELDIIGVTALDGGGALFEGNILSTGSETVMEHGFVWGGANPTLENSDYLVLDTGIAVGPFESEVMAGIENNKVYYARAFLKTTSRISYSNVISFLGGGSIRPELVSIVPNTAICGDTAIIKGRYFSFAQTNNTVLFDNIPARVLRASSDELEVIVPPSGATTIKVKVTVTGYASVNELAFNMLQPVLSYFEPHTGTFDDIVTLHGTNFSLDTSCFRVFFNNARAEVLEMSRSQYKVKVPAENNISPAVVQIRYFNDFSYNEQFSLRAATINEISPVNVRPGDTIHITGEEFNPIAVMNKVIIGEVDAAVISSTATEISVQVPPGLIVGNHTVTLSTIQGTLLVWDGSVEVRTPWIRLTDFPGGARSSATVFSIKESGYIGLGHNADQALPDFWKYSPASDSWSPVRNHPKAGLDYATGFAIDGLGYVTCGKNVDVWYRDITQYNPISDIWQAMTPKPGEGSSMKAPAFVINGRAYVPAAGEMYEFNPQMNTWVKKSYPSALGYFGSGVAFAIGDKGYMGIGWIHQEGQNTPMLFEYDQAIDRWTRKADFPGTPRSNAVFFALPNGRAYVGLGTTSDYQYLNDFWEYNPLTDEWHRLDDFPGTARYSAVAFTIGNKAYIGLGYDGTFKSDFWEFSPGLSF